MLDCLSRQVVFPFFAVLLESLPLLPLPLLPPPPPLLHLLPLPRRLRLGPLPSRRPGRLCLRHLRLGFHRQEAEMKPILFDSVSRVLLISITFYW